MLKSDFIKKIGFIKKEELLMGYLKSWENWEYRVNKYQPLYLIDEKFIQNEKKKLEYACAKIDEISKILEIPIEEAKNIFHYNGYVVQNEISDFPKKLKHYKDLFGKYFIYIIGKDYFGKSFLIKDISFVEEKIKTLQKLFNTTPENIIRMSAYSANYLGYSLKKYEKIIKEWEDYLNTSRETILENFVIYPAMINISMGLTQSRLKRISNNTEEDILKTKEMFKKYPRALEFTPSSIDYALRFNHNRVDLIYEQIKKYPWVLDCVSRVKDHEYCGLSSLHNLFKMAEFIEENFGQVKNVVADSFDEENNDVTFLLTKKHNHEYFIVSLGFLLREDKLLNSIFKQNKVIVRYQRINIDNIHNFGVYQYYSYFAGYRLGTRPKEESLNVKYFEMLPADITGDINKPLVMKIDEDETVEIVHTLKLTNGLAEKYQEMDNEKKIDTNIFLNINYDGSSEEELKLKKQTEKARKDFIENVFGNVENYMQVLKEEN